MRTDKIIDWGNVVLTGTTDMHVQVWFTHPACMPSTVTQLREPSRNPHHDMLMPAPWRRTAGERGEYTLYYGPAGIDLACRTGAWTRPCGTAAFWPPGCGAWTGGRSRRKPPTNWSHHTASKGQRVP
ncbi:hypothetical protein AB0G73_33530 [Streptomyces sp. NPDC020719]|uniref:hypothetical protein n=1 Tax=Streptomyces sp. NPDC020719 TaxID=3154896 RepID=UPI0033C4668B